MEPQTLAERLLWLEHTLEGLAHEVVSIRAQLRALVLRPPTLGGADHDLAELLQHQLELMERQCALVRAQLAHLRAGVTGAARAGPSAVAGPPEEPEDRGTSEKPAGP